MSRRQKHQPLGAWMLAGLSTLAAPALAQPQFPPASQQGSPAGSRPGTQPTTPELPTVRVEAGAEKPDGLRATTTRVGKVLQDPHDVPQAVTTVTNRLMEEQRVGSFREALRNVSGLSFNAAEGGRSGDNISLRGFYTFGDVYLDGIRDTAQYNRETFNLEQIDVLRGAGAMLFGRGQAGGVINQVSKVPLSREQYSLAATVGSHGFREQRADLNKPINAGTGLRVNLMNRQEGSTRRNPTDGSEAEIDRQGIAISLALNQDSASRFWINHYQVKTDDNPDYGISFNAATRRPGTILPSDTYFGNARTFDRSSTGITTLVHEYQFAPRTLLRTQLRHADYDRSYWAKTPNLTTPPNAAGGIGGNQVRASHYTTTTLQSDLSTRFDAFGMKHEVVTGVEYLNEASARKGLQNFGSNAAPLYLPYQEAIAGARTKFDGRSYAIYAQDTVEFIPKWKATAGIRRDQMDATYSSATSPQLKYGENSYRAALSWHPVDQTHVYVAWSDSFSPTADLYQLTVVPLPPERSEVLELGTKWLLFDGDLALRAAIYRANKEFERNADLEATAALLTNRRRTDGIELEAAGRITDRWEVFAGLALMDATILEVATNVNATTGVLTSGNPGYVGQRARNTPRYTFNLWSTYRLDENWTVGGGVEAKGDRLAFNPSGAGAVPTLNGVYQPNTAPSYARWDAMVAYNVQRWTVRLNVRNLFDKVYYDAVYDSGGFTIPGVRRTALVTTEYRF